MRALNVLCTYSATHNIYRHIGKHTPVVINKNSRLGDIVDISKKIYDQDQDLNS